MKILILFFLSFVLLACESPIHPGKNPGKGPVISGPDTTETPGTTTGHKIIVKNSMWVTDREIPISREAIPEDIQTELDLYNNSTIDDFQRAYYDEAPTIEDSPNVTVYACNPENNNPNSVWPDIPRTELVANIAAWKASFQGQVLYIDHIPPPPVQDKVINPYAWYSIYLKDNDTGDILYVEHCGYNPDQSWTSTGGFGQNAVDQFYSIRLSGFNTMVQSPVPDLQGNMHPNCSVVTRTVYVDLIP